MNEKQRVLLAVSAAFVFLMLIFPPFVVHLPNGAVINKGYSFVFSPPDHGYLSATINVPTLIAQWAGIALLAGAGWLLARDVSNTPPASLTQNSLPFGSAATAKTGVSSAAPKVLRAGFWRRVAAYLLDYLILLVCIVVVFAIFGALGVVSPENAEGLGTLFGVVGFWLYFAFSESGSRQATLGKRALAIKVVGLNGRSISFGKASGRHFGKILSGIPLGLGFLMCIFTARKQCLHDMVASCLVVRDYATESEVAVATGVKP